MAKGSDYAGFGISDTETFTIANGATGSAVAAVDLDRQYAVIHIKCEDMQYVQATTTLGAYVGYGASDTLVELHKMDTGEVWATENLPTSGSFSFILNHALGAQRIRLVLSQATLGGAAVFEITGYDPVIKNSD